MYLCLKKLKMSNEISETIDNYDNDDQEEHVNHLDSQVCVGQDSTHYDIVVNHSLTESSDETLSDSSNKPISRAELDAVQGDLKFLMEEFKIVKEENLRLKIAFDQSNVLQHELVNNTSTNKDL